MLSRFWVHFRFDYDKVKKGIILFTCMDAHTPFARAFESEIKLFLFFSTNLDKLEKTSVVANTFIFNYPLCHRIADVSK